MQTLEMTKEDQLWHEIERFNRPFSVIDVNHIKDLILYQRADRTIRTWAEETRIFGQCKYGKLYRIPLEESIMRGLIKKGNAPLAHWEIVSL